MIHLLDGSVVVARSNVDHAHHEAAIHWLSQNEAFAVCPMTEGALLRYFFRTFRDGGGRARQILSDLPQIPGYGFWQDTLSHLDAPLVLIQGHQQVTDAYLVALAAAHGGRLATFDQALVAVHPEAVLVPT